MAKSTPTTFDSTEEPRAAKGAAPKTATPTTESAHLHAEYPGQTLGIVALALSLFAQIPALAMGIVAWVWSHKAGKNNIPAKISVYVSAALIVIGTFFFAFWIAFVGNLAGGFDPDGDHRFDGGPMPVQILPGQDMPGDMGGMMRGFEGDIDGQQGSRMMPAPSTLPSDAAVTN